jgi:ATP-dependent exoDNAse (exonuclease V) beta subunit
VSQDPKIFQFPEVCVVEASAGSGKTYTLAKRYVQLLLHPKVSPEHPLIRSILAITFTNKAAFEMKVRILEFLRKIALGRLSVDEAKDILGPLHLTPQDAGRKAYALMDELIRHYNFFQVQTIDSFINALLSGCAFKIGLSANFRIKTNAGDYLEQSLDRLIDAAHHDKRVLKMFQNFMHQYLFVENRTGWFPKKEILGLVSTLFEQSNIFAGEFSPGGEDPKEILAGKTEVFKLVKRLQKHLPEGTNKGFVKALDAFLSGDPGHFSIDDLSSYFSREQIPVNKGTQISSEAEEIWQDARGHLKRIVEEESRSMFRYYVEVFNDVLFDFRRLAGKDDILFLSELNKAARLLFDEEKVTVEELYYRLAGRFRHYLVDEFQDTSLLQWENLILMVEEALSTGGSLFYVGDKKQAIYGFRGGEVLLFDTIQERFSPFNVHTRTLSKNYRSQKAVVEFNNHVFSPDNLKRFIIDKESGEKARKNSFVVEFTGTDVRDVLNIFHGAEQTWRDDRGAGYVRIAKIDSDNIDERDRVTKEKFLELVKDLRRRFACRDIAVLTRGNKEVELVTSWLLEAGTFVESERTTNIKENFLVKELISFLRFLNSPIDNLAFSSFILGEIFAAASGVPLDELRRFVFDLRQRKKQEHLYVYKEFRDRYPALWDDLMEEFFANVGLYPLYELVLTVLFRFHCMEKFPEYQGFLMRFLEIIKKQEEESADIESFLEFFETAPTEELYINISQADAVKVLTVHKSKGLEFPVVILPFLGMDVQAGSQAGQGEKSYTIQKEEDGLRLLHLKSKYLNFSPELAEIYKQEYKKSFLAELNNVYVALTRPRHELYVFVPKKMGNAYNVINFLIPEERVEYGKQVPYPQVHKKDPATLLLPVSKYRDWLGLLKEEFGDTDHLRDRVRALQGDAMHLALSLVGRLSRTDDMDAVLGPALEEVQRLLPAAHIDVAGLKQTLRQLLEKEAVRPFFFVDGGVIYQEKEVVNAYGHTKRIDRLIVKDNEVWVVDYKSSRADEETHRRQVEEYMEIVKELYPGKKIKGHLIYLDTGTVERV